MDTVIWNNGVESNSVPANVPGVLVASLIACDSIERSKYASVRYIASGHAVYSALGRQIVLKKGDALFINAGVEVEFQVSKYSRCLGASVRTGLEGSECADLPAMLELNPALSNIGAMIYKMGEQFDQGENMQNLLSFYEETESIETNFWIMLRALLVSMSRIQCKNRRTAADLLEKAHMASKLLQQDNKGELALIDVAERVGVSKYHLLRIYKDIFGFTPIAYRDSSRLLKAREQLHFGGTISSIAEEFGYSDSYSFSKAFKRRYGMSPRRSEIALRA